MSQTFAVEPEPKSNHVPPRPFWNTPRSARDGVREECDNLPEGRFQKERAERLSESVRIALRGQAGLPARRQVGRDEPLPDGRAGDGLLIQSLAGDDPGSPSEPGQIARVGEIRHILARDIRIKDLPPRGAVSAPARVDVDWYPRNGGPTRRLTQQGHNLLGKYLKLSFYQESARIGLTATMAGQFEGTGKTRAAELVKELEEAGDAHRWLIRKAMPLIASGKIPRGRDTIPDTAATGFFRALIQYESRVERWLWDIGYKVKLDPPDLDAALKRLEPFEREGMEYLIQSRLLWMLYP